jgi:serine/threonine protein kinase
MSPRDRKDASRPETEENLVSSEDLFSELVDEPSAPARPREGPVREDRIKVRVAEPGRGGPAARAPELPEDMAALLDVIGGGDERSPAAAPPTPPGADTDPGVGGPGGEERPPLRRIPDDVEQLVNSVLSPIVEKPGPSPPRPDPPGVSAKAAAPGSRAAPPESRPEAKFRAAAPKVTEGPGLDLGALADAAFASTPTADLSVPPPKGARSAPGRSSFGPYTLVKKVSVGGMAEVFRAKRSGVEGFEKTVAVKRILPHLSDNKEFVDMFINEAKMVAGLTHPSIVQIFDLGRIDRSYYIAMEYVHGRDLRSILKRAKDRGIRTPLDLSAHVASRVSAALEYAHRKKDERGQAMEIVHRDISPQNILISFEGDVKLTDFGIAKAATKASTTDRGALRGKLLYMSPEQAWGKAIDRRSDIFSLGIVLYEMLTDQKPFIGSSEMGVLEMVRRCKVASPTTLNPRIPEKLERVVIKALQREPEDRYQDASEMHADLERALHERRPPTASELARFLELLFDDDERDDAVGEGEVEELRSPEAGHDTGGVPGATPTPAGGAMDAMPIERLLKRFGIK